MNIVSVAVGKQYELEVQRLIKAYPQTIVITERTPGVETSFDLPLLNGLATKCKFGLLIPEDLEGPILFCDADLYPVIEDPLQYFKVKDDTDIAYVPYPGRWFFPPTFKDLEDAINKIKGKLNSGFIYFKDIEVCQDICFRWHKEYLKRMKLFEDFKLLTHREGEFDEPSLVMVLANSSYNIEHLDPKWNVWGNEHTISINESHNIKDTYFRQWHMNDYSPYQSFPTIS
jgi:hypothetical protein